MTGRRELRRWSAFTWCLLALCSTLTALGQNGNVFDVNSCFPELLRNHYDFKDHELMTYRLLTLWNREAYESSKLDTAIYTAYGAGTLDQSQDKVTRELQSKNISIDYDRMTAWNFATLDPQAGQIIKDCLSHVFSQFGARTTIQYEDQRYLDVTIHWKGTSGEPLKIKQPVALFNANVVDPNGKLSRTPFAPDKPGTDFEIPSGSSRSVRLERTGPYQEVIIRLTVSPDIEFEDIHAPPVPEIVTYEPYPQRVGPTDGHVDWIAKTWINDPQHNNGLIPRPDLTYFGHNYYSMTHDISELSDNPTAVFQNATCEKYGIPNDFGDIDGANPTYAVVVRLPTPSRTLTCVGWYNALGRSIVIKTDWVVTGYRPIPHKWEPWYPPASKSK